MQNEFQLNKSKQISGEILKYHDIISAMFFNKLFNVSNLFKHPGRFPTHFSQRKEEKEDF